jgi:hypothetical protein
MIGILIFIGLLALIIGAELDQWWLVAGGSACILAATVRGMDDEGIHGTDRAIDEAAETERWEDDKRSTAQRVLDRAGEEWRAGFDAAVDKLIGPVDYLEQQLLHEEHRRGQHPLPEVAAVRGCPGCQTVCPHMPPGLEHRPVPGHPATLWTCTDCGHQWIMRHEDPGRVERH